MRFEIGLARRYLRSPARGLTKITAYLGVAGIAIGVAAMIFALALSRGFREEVQEKLLANTPHISITGNDGSPLENTEQIRNDLSKIDGIKTVNLAVFENALLVTAQTSTYTVLAASDEIQPERKGECGTAFFGSELAKKAGLKPGDVAEVVLSRDGEPRKICLLVKDIFSTGFYEYDSTQIKLSLKEFSDLTDSRASTFVVTVQSVYDSRRIAKVISSRLGADYKVLDWQESNKPLFAAMSFERRVVLATVSLVILLSGVMIAFTLILGVAQRRQDIAILRTAGAKSGKIVRAFLVEGLCLGAIGVILGVILGLLACFFSNYFGLLELPAGIYFLNKIDLRIDPMEILVVAAATLFFISIVSLYPALLAARIKPWENLRQ